MPVEYSVYSCVGRALAASFIRSFAILSIVALALLVHPQSPFCATVDDANQDATRIQQQQQRQLDQLGKTAEERKSPPPPSPKIDRPLSGDQIEDQQCVFIKEISIEGNTLLSAATIADLTTPYTNRCLSLNDINNLLQSITRFYFDRGYVTSRAYLKPQDLGSGTLIVTVIEGRIESLCPRDAALLSDAEIHGAFPTSSGRTLNLRALEQGLDNLNRLSSNSVRMQLEPGTNPGDSHILLDNVRSRPWTLIPGVDNYGQISTGRYQGHVAVGIDNPSGHSDYLNLNITHDLHPGRSKMSRGISGRYEWPQGWWLFGISANMTEYHKELMTEIQTFDTSGSAQNIRIAADRVLQRSQAGKWMAGLALTLRDERNYLEDVLLTSSSQRLSVVSGSIRHQHRLPHLAFSSSVTLHQGFPVLGAQSDHNLSADTPRTRFTKVSGNLSIDCSINMLPTPVRLSVYAQGQTSDGPLYGSEQLGIGGLYTIRGYLDSGFSGERGGYVRNEVTVPFHLSEGTTSHFLDRLETFVAFDWGAVKTLGDADNSFNELAGWGVGLRGSGKAVYFDLLYARPLSPPDILSDQSGALSFAVSMYL